MIIQQRQLTNRRLRITHQCLQNLAQMRRQLRHVLLAEMLAGIAEAHRQGFAQIDHQSQRVMSLLLGVQAAEHQPLRRGLLQRFGHRVVFEHQNVVEQRLASAACPALNLVQRCVFMLTQGDVLRLHLLNPVRHPLFRARAGDYRQGVDEQPQLLLDARQVSRTPSHGCAKGCAGLPRVALQHQQPGRLHQRVEGDALLAGKLAQLAGAIGIDQLQVIAMPLLAPGRFEGLNQPGRLVQFGKLAGPETFTERSILALQPFDIVAITTDLPRQRLAAVALQHLAQQTRAAPAIHENVMAGVDQLMRLFASAQYGQAQKWPPSQVETLLAIGIRPIVDPFA
ncbi:Uncharacterized protein AC509_5005 [Pseudomonas amygdali pv. morsprunorum]|nr:Uncharacterized protein AC509_5005 [Pseudomonas amygdali pv. morsprunorum]